MLTLIGLGLRDGKDITLRGLDAVKQASAVYIEGYTSLLQCTHEELESTLAKKIIILTRNDIEQKIDKILERAKKEDIAILIIGDVFGATTHTDLFLRATDLEIKVDIINNASIINAIGTIGLELYRYGKVVSLPYWLPSFEPTSFLTGIQENHTRGLHTLCLLDIKADEARFMSVAEGLQHLLSAEKKLNTEIITEETIVVGVARMGCADMKIIPGRIKELLLIDFGKPPHCFVIPGKMHPIEEEMLAFWKKKAKN